VAEAEGDAPGDRYRHRLTPAILHTPHTTPEIEMLAAGLNAFLKDQIAGLKAQGLYKAERPIATPQDAAITVNGRAVVNFCANNYLGLSNHPEIVAAAHEGLKTWGYGLSSVRFICGTQSVHKAAEAQVAKFFGKADAILYIACFDANGGLFEPLLG